MVEETVGHGTEGLEMNFYPLELFASLANIPVNLIELCRSVLSSHFTSVLSKFGEAKDSRDL